MRRTTKQEEEVAVAYGEMGAFLVQRECGTLRSYYVTPRGIVLRLGTCRHKSAQRAADALAKKDRIFDFDDDDLNAATDKWHPTHLVDGLPHMFVGPDMDPRLRIRGGRLQTLDPADPFLNLYAIRPSVMLEVARAHWDSLGYEFSPADQWDNEIRLRNGTLVEIWLFAIKPNRDGSMSAVVSIGWQRGEKHGQAIGRVAAWGEESGAKIAWFGEVPIQKSREMLRHIDRLFLAALEDADNG